MTSPISGKTQIQDVYYVDLGKRGQFILAIAPEIFQDRIEWADGSSGKSGRNIQSPPKYEYKEGQENPETIILELEGGKIMELHKLAVDVFNAKIQRWTQGKPKFNTDKELKEHFMNLKLPRG